MAFLSLSKSNMIVAEEVDSVVRQTSTPCHENAKTFNSSELNLSGANHHHQHHYHHQHHLHSNSSHQSFTSHKIITQVDVQLEAEIKAKEKYLEDLKSIDLAKFSFANEQDFYFDLCCYFIIFFKCKLISGENREQTTPTRIRKYFLIILLV